MTSVRHDMEALARVLPSLEGSAIDPDPRPRGGAGDATTPGGELAAESRTTRALRALATLEALWTSGDRRAVRALFATYVMFGEEARARWTTGWGRHLALLLSDARGKLDGLAAELRAGQGPAAHGLEVAGQAALGAAETAYAETTPGLASGAWLPELRAWLARSQAELATAAQAALAERAARRAQRKARRATIVSETESSSFASPSRGMETQPREPPGADVCPEHAA